MLSRRRDESARDQDRPVVAHPQPAWRTVMDHPTSVIIEVEETGPARRGADATEELRQELARLGTAQVSAPGRPQSRAIDVATLGQIVVTVSGVAGGLLPVVETVRRWLQARAASRRVRLEIDGDVLEVSGLDSDAQQELVDRWLERHQAPA
jgi:hypothetical protein